MLRRRNFGWRTFTPPIARGVGDIVCYNRASDRFRIGPIPGTDKIGIVVIPSSFTIPGRTPGYSTIMALRKAHYDDNEHGLDFDENRYTRFGLFEKDIPETKTNLLYHIGYHNDFAEGNRGYGDKGYLPSDRFTGQDSPDDTPARYDSEAASNADGYNIPSPYTAQEGILHVGYIDPASGLSDFNGRANTAALLQYAPENWENTAVTYDTSREYPIGAMLCAKYSTPGTSPGDWYMPSVGQGIFWIARLRAIINALSSIGISFPIDDKRLFLSNNYNDVGCRYINFKGRCDWGYKSDYQLIIPFTDVLIE